MDSGVVPVLPCDGSVVVTHSRQAESIPCLILLHPTVRIRVPDHRQIKGCSFEWLCVPDLDRTIQKSLPHFIRPPANPHIVV